MKQFQVLTINPGSTSTKVAIFKGDTLIFSKNIAHDAAVLETFPDVTSQKDYRARTIYDCLKEAGVALTDLDAVVGRGGGLLPLEGGTYAVTETLLNHARRGANGVQHPAQLGPQLADEFARRSGAKAFVVNPPDVDELQDLARMTGIKGIYRMVHLHALNLKETAIRHAAKLGKRYEECNFIVCHIGGGISVSAHRKGRMVDGFDIAGGEGPMAPTRCGSISVANLLDYAQDHSLSEIRSLCTKSGGFVSHVGISDAVELTRRAAQGDAEAAMVWNTMLYQIEKCIGAMASVLNGQVDGILLSGGMVHSDDLVAQISDTCSWIAPVTAYPGEFEMEAMAAGAIRVLRGEEKLKTYTGIPVWSGFAFEKQPEEKCANL